MAEKKKIKKPPPHFYQKARVRIRVRELGLG